MVSFDCCYDTGRIAWEESLPVGSSRSYCPVSTPVREFFSLVNWGRKTPPLVGEPSFHEQAWSE